MQLLQARADLASERSAAAAASQEQARKLWEVVAASGQVGRGAWSGHHRGGSCTCGTAPHAHMLHALRARDACLVCLPQCAQEHCRLVLRVRVKDLEGEVAAVQQQLDGALNTK